MLRAHGGSMQLSGAVAASHGSLGGADLAAAVEAVLTVGCACGPLLARSRQLMLGRPTHTRICRGPQGSSTRRLSRCSTARYARPSLPST